MLSKLFKALNQTRSSLANTFRSIKGEPASSESLEMLEEQLLMADLGVDTVDEILDVIKRHSGQDFESKVREYLLSIMPERYNPTRVHSPTVIMMVGVNGAGKTITAAKLARVYKQLDQNVMLVAADTYRAAATEQLKIWSGRAGTRLVCNERTLEPSAVLFDGLNAAKSSREPPPPSCSLRNDSSSNCAASWFAGTDDVSIENIIRRAMALATEALST